MLKKLLKWLDRTAESVQMWVRRYEMPVLVKRTLTDDDCNMIQAVTEMPVWQTLKTVLDNVNWERNTRAKSFCDGRSFVEFKKMDGATEFFQTVEEIVNLHKLKTTPAPEPSERPRKISEHVPR